MVNSLCREPAVDIENVAGHEGCFLRKQPADSPSNFARITHAIHRMHSRDCFFIILPELYLPLDKVRAYGPWGDRVDANSLLCMVQRAGFRETNDGVLRRRIGRGPRDAVHPSDRRKIYDGAAALAVHLA